MPLLPLRTRVRRALRAGALALAFMALAVPFGVATPRAAAQEDRATGAARSLFQEGLRLVDAGEWAPARDRFERALALRRSSAIAFNLATACVHVGKLVEAIELFEEVARADAATADVRTASIEQLTRLRARIGHLVVHVDGALAGVTVRLDGEALPAALIDVATPVDPGLHAGDAERDGSSVAHASVDVPSGGSAQLTLDVPTAPTPRATARALVGAPSTREVAAPHGDDTWLWVGIAAGAVVIVAVLVAAVAVAAAGPSVWNGDTSPGILRW